MPETIADLNAKMDAAWAKPDPADAANLLREVVLDAISALVASQRRSEAAEKYIGALLRHDDKASNNEYATMEEHNSAVFTIRQLHDDWLALARAKEE